MHQISKRTLTLALIATTAIACANAESGLPDTTRIVVAIRYLEAKGASHARLFLYSGDGKLLREFANDSKGQDRDPIFSPDGKTVVFRRESDSKNEFFRVNANGSVPQRITASPSWYFETLKRPLRRFDFPPEQSVPSDPKEIRIKDNVGIEDIHYPASDGTTEIVLKLRSDADPGRTYFGKEPWLREKEKPDVKVSQLPFTTLDASGKEEERRMRNAPGVNEHYESGSDPGDLEGVMQYAGSPFIWRPPLRVAIVRQHRGITFGEGFRSGYKFTNTS